MKNRHIKRVTLALTKNCNLNCIYCYERHKNEDSMSFEVAKRIIKRELTNEDEYDTVCIDFFGGEPFLEFELIKEICSFVESQSWPKNYFFTTTTNGTLVHGLVQEWLIKNKNKFDCGLSLDGTQEMHNMNRPYSYEKIDLDFFSKDLKSKVKMTISPNTLPFLSKGVIHLNELGFDVACNLAYEMNWENYDMITTLEKELNKLIDYYLNKPQMHVCSMLNLPISHIDGKVSDKVKNWCGSGVQMYTYDTQGKCYPCQYFMPISLGESANQFENKRFEQIYDKEELSEYCKSCVLLKACPNCLGANYNENGNIRGRSLRYCRYIKTMLLANSYFKWQQLKRNHLRINKENRYLLLRGIEVIQSEIRSKEF